MVHQFSLRREGLALRRMVVKKNGEGMERSLAARIKTAIDFDYQTNRTPSCMLRLPPLNDLFFKNCALVTKTYAKSCGLPLVVESSAPLFVGKPRLKLRWLNVL